MTNLRLNHLKLPDTDLDFVVREVGVGNVDKGKMKRLIKEDTSFRKALIGDDNAFRKVVSDEEVFLKISPLLYFEILLRHSLKDLEKATYTLEKVDGSHVPVFDTKRVADLLAEEEMLEYLADMLASFTRVESYTIPVRVRKGIWRRIRFSDVDVDALTRFCMFAGDDDKFSFYKRIADVCLFILGIFPEYAHFDYSYTFKEEVVPEIRSIWRRGIQEYAEIGTKFYKLAAEHPSAKLMQLNEVFKRLHDNFNLAWKPLNFLAQHYLRHNKSQVFGANQI